MENWNSNLFLQWWSTVGRLDLHKKNRVRRLSPPKNPPAGCACYRCSCVITLMSRLHTLLNRSDYRREAVKRTVYWELEQISFFEKKNGILLRQPKLAISLQNGYANMYSYRYIWRQLWTHKNKKISFNFFSNGMIRWKEWAKGLDGGVPLIQLFSCSIIPQCQVVIQDFQWPFLYSVIEVK
jgi:hypothetical protein